MNDALGLEALKHQVRLTFEGSHICRPGHGSNIRKCKVFSKEMYQIAFWTLIKVEGSISQKQEGNRKEFVCLGGQSSR